MPEGYTRTVAIFRDGWYGRRIGSRRIWGWRMKLLMLVVCATAISCASTQFVLAAPAVSETVLYSFRLGNDGGFPDAPVTRAGNAYYGTTNEGGLTGYGTVFKLSDTGAETVLHSFAWGDDGFMPTTDLVKVGDKLYGTAYGGGNQGNCYYYGCGIIFSISLSKPTVLSDPYRVVYRFESQNGDGGNPWAGLINVSGTLYGTTSAGGSDGVGTVYAINPSSGTETVVYSFQNDRSDGQQPYAALTNVNGILYGTTYQGGTHGDGTVFSIDPAAGTEKVLHSFQNDSSDGGYPQANLIQVGGTLYGTTTKGGASGNGTIFSVDPATGLETALFSFNGASDGRSPVAGLTDVNGMLYGTTSLGGAHSRGTVFSFDTAAGSESVLYSFCSDENCSDGSSPDASLIVIHGKLYGTTYFGGSNGYGTVFAITR